MRQLRIFLNSQKKFFPAPKPRQAWEDAAQEARLKVLQAARNRKFRLLGQLAQSMEEMAEELMDEERIACEAESDRLWMQVEGYPQSYTVQFILNAGRRGEGKWPAEAVASLVREARILKTF